MFQLLLLMGLFVTFFEAKLTRLKAIGGLSGYKVSLFIGDPKV